VVRRAPIDTFRRWHSDSGVSRCSGTIADFDIGIPSEDQMLPTARRDARPSGWKRAALRDQLIERGFAIDFSSRITIEINRPYSARRTHWRANHGIRILLPPREDLRLVSSRILETVWSERPLVDRIARKDRDAATRVVKRGLEYGRWIGLRLRAHVILPSSLRNKAHRYCSCLVVNPRLQALAISSMNL
jgi:hypothetical protein